MHKFLEAMPISFMVKQFLSESSCLPYMLTRLVFNQKFANACIGELQQQS